jgi:hypothetical protein
VSALGGIRAATAKASVNLRGDLAKLSDAELAERLDAAWQAVDAAQDRQRGFWLLRSYRLFPPWRGPLRHPRFYRFFSIWTAGEGHWLAALIAAAFSGPKYEPLLRRDPDTDEHLSVCEVRDIMDEIQRRLALRNANL